MNNLQTITSTLLETNKADRLYFAQRTIEQIEDGELNPLEVHMQVKAMEDIITLLTSTDEKKNTRGCKIAHRYKKLLFDEAEKHGKTFEYHNSKFAQREVGVKYDFSLCNDPVLGVLEFEKEGIDLKVKERQDFLKGIPAEGIDFMTEEGEIVKLYPPLKTSTTSITVSMK